MTDQPIDRDLRDRLADLVRARRAVRAYRPGPLDEDLVREYLGLILEAPSAFNLQDPGIILIRDPGVRARVLAAAGGQRQVAEAPLLLAFLADPAGWRRTLPEVTERNLASGYWDEAAAAERGERIRAFQRARAEAGLAREFALRNAMIAATYGILLAPAFGWASSPMTGFDDAALKVALGAPAEATVALLLAVGEPAEDPPHPGRLPLARRVHLDRWGGPLD